MKKIAVLLIFITVLTTVIPALAAKSAINRDKAFYVCITDSTTGKTKTLPRAQYIMGVIANFSEQDDEVLKALAIVLNTYIISGKSGENCPAPLSKEQMRTKFSDRFEYEYNRLREIVRSTDRTVIISDGRYADIKTIFTPSAPLPVQYTSYSDIISYYYPDSSTASLSHI